MKRPSHNRSPRAFLGKLVRPDHGTLRAGFFGVGLLLASALGTCDSPPPSTIGPLVHVSLDSLAAGASKVSLKVTSQGRDKSVEFSTAPLDDLGITFDPGTTGAAEVEVQVFDATGCLLSSGKAAIKLESDIDYALPIKMTAIPFCGMPAAKLIVQLVNGVDGSGTVTGPGINCGGGGSDCEELFLAGTKVDLVATAQRGNFLGWSGSCNSNGGCSITLTPAGDFTVQASFGVCQGWCAEPSSLGATQQWNAVYGISATDVMIVGNGGAISHWDGTSWKSMLSGTTKNLYGVTVPRGSNTYVAVGQTGTVLGYSGQGWYPIAVPAGTKDLFGVSGVSKDEIRIVGASGTLLRGNLSGFAVQGGGEALPTNGTSKTLYAIHVQVNNGNSGEYNIVGSAGYSARRNYDLFGNGSWDEPTAFANKDLLATWYSKMRTVAVGQTGTLISRTYKNLAWQGWQNEAPTGLTTNLNGVWGIAENSNWAVGDGGKIYRWDGGTWTVMLSNTTIDLLGVWGTGDKNLYAVGKTNTLLHYIQ